MCIYIYIFFFFKINLFILGLGLHCCEGFSLVAKSRDCSLVAVRGLVIAVISLAALGHSGVSNSGTWAQ